MYQHLKYLIWNVGLKSKKNSEAVNYRRAPFGAMERSARGWRLLAEYAIAVRIIQRLLSVLVTGYFETLCISSSSDFYNLCVRVYNNFIIFSLFINKYKFAIINKK